MKIFPTSSSNRSKYTVAVLLIGTALLLVSSFLSISLGRYPISLNSILSIIQGKEIIRSEYHIIVNLRIPRLLASILVGAALSASGMMYQSIFQNPLVSPDLLGVTSGACVGAAFSIVLGLSSHYIALISFFIGILSVLLCLGISSLTRNKTNLILVFAGIIIGRFMDSVIGMLKYFADAESQLGDIVNWQLGTMSKVTMPSVRIMSIIILPCLTFSLLLRWRLNILSIGEKDAYSLGVNVKTNRIILIALSTLLTAASVCFCGTISWVGLIMPHIARWIMGSDNRRTLPFAMILGSCFLVISDLFARAATDYELPLGVITGLVGAPVFGIILLKRSKRTI